MSFVIIDNNLSNSDLLKNESIFHTANGYLGVRGNFEEGYKRDYKTIRGTYINAFHEVNKIQYGERLHGFPDTKQSILNLIDTQGIKLVIDGDEFSLFSGDIISYGRTFDLKSGFTNRKIHWKSPKGHEIMININRMTSFECLELFLISYNIESINYEGKISLTSSIDADVSNFSAEDDPRVSSEKIKSLVTERIYIKDDISTIFAHTKKSNLKLACSTYHYLSKASSTENVISDKRIDTHIDLDLKVNESVKLVKFSCFTDSLRHPATEEQSRQLCENAYTKGEKYYFDKQVNYLEEFWKNSGITLDNNELLQQGINYNMYQLLQSVGKDKFSNICAKGLSGEGYEGHYFWDTEIYMFPFFLLTEPQLAKNLLRFRHGLLDSARGNARSLGHKKGALFPWRTITGSECSAFFPAGTAQYHINADIAYSFIKYYLVTEDIDFIYEYGAEVLFETARLWMDTGHFKDGTFFIEGVTGPDEYSCIVNNNYYTNLMVKYNLKWAYNFYILLKDKKNVAGSMLFKTLGIDEMEALAFKQAADQMYLPYDEKLDINPQDDSFLNKAVWDFENTPKENYPLLLNYHPLLLYRHQVCKQADTVLAHFLLEEDQSYSTLKNSYGYYEKVTTHDSSLSSCIFSIMASRLGYEDKAFDYFIDSVRLDLDDTHGNTKDGIHTANMGGTYLAIVYGFGGLRVKDDGIYFNPKLPKGWEGYSFKIKYKNRDILVKVNKGKKVFTLLGGEPLELKLLRNNSEIVALMLENVIEIS